MPFLKKSLYSIKSSGNTSKIQCDKIVSFKDMLLQGVDYQRTPYTYNKQAIIVHSGGTTGVLKGVLLSNDNMNSIAWQNINYGIDYKSGEKFLHSIPPFHAFGLALGIHMPLCLGLTLVLSVKIDEESIYNYFSQYKPNYVIVGPTHALMIVNKCDFNISFVNMFCLGGAGVTNEQEEQINSFLESHGSKSKACIGYGLSETGSEICAEINKWYGKLGSVGIPFCKANCKIINTDSLQEQKYNEVGEICFSGPGIMLGYYNNDEETNSTLFYKNNEKWLHTGDLGYIDQDGFLFITGRLKRIYPTRTTAGGTFYKLFPDYVESTIKKLDYIKTCAVVCLEDLIYKNIAIAFVEMKEKSSKTEKDILDQLREILPEHSIPKRVIQVDSLPLTPIGKIDYRALEKMAEEMEV